MLLIGVGDLLEDVRERGHHPAHAIHHCLKPEALGFAELVDGVHVVHQLPAVAHDARAVGREDGGDDRVDVGLLGAA